MVDLATLEPVGLDAVFTDDLAYCAGMLSFGAHSDEFVRAADLLDPDVLEPILERFGTGYPDGDRRAVVSLWSQWYFGTLLVPTVSVSLLLGRTLPLRLETVSVRLDPERHHAVEVRLPHAGDALRQRAPERLLHDLVWEHLDPLVRTLSRVGGVADRLLWSNAGGYLEWVVRQLERRPEGAATASAADLLLAARAWPGRDANPLFQPVRYVCEDGGDVRRRRVCCLRYMLPGVAGCGQACPLARVRAASD